MAYERNGIIDKIMTVVVNIDPNVDKLLKEPQVLLETYLQHN
jgi:hypothetical protein